jgi:rhodanese-related sulfurtransferase
MSQSLSTRIVINIVILIAALCAAGYCISLFWLSVAPAKMTDIDPAQTITAPELKELLVHKNDTITIVDIRERDEFLKEHIPSAINIPFDELEVRAEDELPKSSHIILSYYKCGEENRVGAITSSSLKNLGFGNVTVLDGGINKWKEFSHELDKEKRE